jgi:drug/metabolite transporter (DMT)-like permease
MLVALRAASAQRPAVLGYLAAVVAVVLTSVYPAVTRVSVTTTLTPADLLMLRLGVSGILFAPYLLWKARDVPKDIWRAGVRLSFFQGWGMAGCAIFGLQFAPASHSAALGPGVISAWIAAMNFLLYGVTASRQKLSAIAAIVAGVVLLLMGSFGGLSTANALTGDALFLAASALGALYLVYVQHRRLDPVLGAALVSTYSAVLLLPWYLLFAKSALATASATEIGWQVVFQGLLMGAGVFIAINYAVLTVGSQTVGVLFALVPMLGLLSSLAITNDPVLPGEWAAIATISFGVFIGARPNLRGRKDSGLLAKPHV